MQVPATKGPSYVVTRINAEQLCLSRRSTSIAIYRDDLLALFDALYQTSKEAEL